MKRPRDSQRLRCYKAERSVAGPNSIWLFTKQLEKVECKQFVEDVMLSNYVRHYWGHKQPARLIFKGNKQGEAILASNEIILPEFAQNKRYILHEIAHLLLSRWEEPHGALFCATLLDLYRIFLGDGGVKAEKLRWAFVNRGVCFIEKPIHVIHGMRKFDETKRSTKSNS